MKKIRTTDIAALAGAPFVKATHDHINESRAEITSAIVKGLIGNYTTNDIIVLYGCAVTATIPGTSSVTAGAIYYNGEIYEVDANASISTPANTLVWSIVTTYRAGDPIEWADGNNRNLHQIDKFRLTNAVSGTGIADYNGATVKYYSYLHRNATATTSNLTNISSVSTAIIQSIIRTGVVTDVTVTIQATVTTGASASSIDISLPTEAFVQNSLYSTPGTFPASGTIMIENNTTGAIVAVKSIHNGLNATDAYILSNKIRCGLAGGSVGNGEQVEWSVSLRCRSSF